MLSYKLFIESMNGPYYYKIGVAEFDKMWGQSGVRMGTNHQEMTEREKELISSVLDHKPVGYDFDFQVMGGKHSIKILGPDMNYYVNKVKDDWWVVSCSFPLDASFKCYYFKCDQIEGLCGFLKEIVLDYNKRNRLDD